MGKINRRVTVGKSFASDPFGDVILEIGVDYTVFGLEHGRGQWFFILRVRRSTYIRECSRMTFLARRIRHSALTAHAQMTTGKVFGLFSSVMATQAASFGTSLVRSPFQGDAFSFWQSGQGMTRLTCY